MQFLRWYLCLMLLIGAGGFVLKADNDRTALEPVGFRVTSHPPQGMQVDVGGYWRCDLAPMCRSQGPQTYRRTPYEQQDRNGWTCLERGGCQPTAKDPPYSEPGDWDAGTSI